VETVVPLMKKVVSTMEMFVPIMEKVVPLL
jgi:hypothetical protein